MYTEAKAEYQRKYKIKNKDKITAYNQRYYDKNRVKILEQYRNERILSKKRRQDNDADPDLTRLYQEIYKDENYEKIQDYQKKYRETHVEERRIYQKMYREKQKQLKNNVKEI